jgi:hypothetical protein
MSRTVSQSLALQCANIVMEALTRHYVEQIVKTSPDSKEIASLYRLIGQHGQRAYNECAKALNLGKII